jgi:tetratricopeptide (TPR) repeat protein
MAAAVSVGEGVGMIRTVLRTSSLLLVLALGACASAAPRPGATATLRYPEFPVPEVPAALKVPQDIRDRHLAGWQRLQAGDTRGATREFTEVLKRSPEFYPAETGLGFVALAERQYAQAASRFSAAVARDARYEPALTGQVQAHVALGNYDEAVAAMEKLTALDPKRDRTQLEMLRFRQVQGLIESGRNARQAKRLEEADSIFSRALALSPQSAIILRELAVTEVALGQLAEAEAHARRAVLLDANDADAHATLGAVLEALNRPQEAGAAYARAAALDDRWKSKAASLNAAAAAALPEGLRDIATVPTVNRAQLAGLIGTRLTDLLGRAPRRTPAIITDVQGHWAAPWIVPVAQAGVMEVFSNYTFQPGAAVRRGELAQAVSQLLTLAFAGRGAQLTQWQAARPAFPDVSSSNLYYRAAALAVAAGVMSADDTGRFFPTRPATGSEATAAITRIEQLAKR